MKKRFLPILRPILGLAIAGAAVFVTWPLEVMSYRTRLDLWRAGVVRVEQAGLQGWMADRCGNHPENCRCVALIHGLADQAATWKKLLVAPGDRWAEPVKIYAFNLPGTGASKKPPTEEGYEARHQAEAIQKALSGICPRWTVVGNSLGGWIGAWLALQWPAGVKSLVLVDSAGFRDLLEVRPFFLEKPTREWVERFRAMIYDKPDPIPFFAWREILPMIEKSSMKAVVLAQRKEDLLEDQLPKLRVPTALIWGESDRLIPISQGKKFLSLIQGATWTQVPRCGHLPQKECRDELIHVINGEL